MTPKSDGIQAMTGVGPYNDLQDIGVRLESSQSRALLYYRLRNGLGSFAFRFLFARFFKHYGKRARLIFPLGIEGISNISIGDDTYIGYRSYLAAVPLTGQQSCVLELGPGCNIGSFNHIYATKRIVIGRNVLTANGVYISDNSHDYRSTSMPIKEQGIIQREAVKIGDGSWLGHNVCVLGATIGRNCIVGANSVVTKDIPDYCMAVGSPARVIKRFNPETKIWAKTDLTGRFVT